MPPAPGSACSAEVRPEIETGLALLEALRGAPASLDWFYVSPAIEFGAWLPQRVTGRYRLSDDVLLTDEAGESHLSAADLALAVLDEIEHPRHSRRRFHVAH
jgi:putative NADH-flavin reductase